MHFRSRYAVVSSFIASVLLLTGTAEAALVVTNSNDAGQGSLRAAVGAAPAGEIILFDIPSSDPGFDSSTGVFTITLTSGEIVIDKDLTIAGPAAANVAISGNQASRIFRIAAGTVSLADLTLTRGRVVGRTPTQAEGSVYDGEPARGGAILNDGTLTCTRCTFESNSVTGGEGRSETARGGLGGEGTGGAIDNRRELSLVACALTDNSATGGKGGLTGFGITRGYAGGGIAAGGAVYNASGASVRVSNCTLAANSATTPYTPPRGGIAPGVTTNKAHGGAIANLGSAALIHSTISNNTATAGERPDGPPGGESFGGGVYAAQGASSSLRDSILAVNRVVGSNSGTSTAGPDVNGTVTSEGHNLLGRSDAASGFRADDLQGGTTEETRLDPKLGPLGNYGGPTKTLPLQDGSPAIDAADTAGPTRDQRGFLRKAQPDIGAFEFGGASPSVLRNISTRAHVRRGDAVIIGGFIITGSQLKTVVIRGIGPSLGIAEALADPAIEVYDGSGALVATNDNWINATTRQQISDSGLAPNHEGESALWGVINPGAYTVAVRGKNDSTGIALVEVYDLDASVNSALANISTRGLVETGDNVMIGGFIVVGDAPRPVVVRALGPSLPTAGALPDPTLELYDRNGVIIAANDNWRSDAQVEIEATTLSPSRDEEAAIVRRLTAGSYTAIVRGANGTSGVALVEVYALD